MLEVFAPGVPVKLRGIDATVISSLIESGGKVSYKVVWWDGRTRNEKWVESFEVERKSSDSKRQRIGFGDS